MPRTHANNKKVLVAMSGGVDSSVAAAVLQQQGYEVVGCFMRLGSDDSVESAEHTDEACCPPSSHETEGADEVCPSPDAHQSTATKAHHQGCCSLNDASDARLVAAMLGIPLYVMNFKKDFGRIIDYFVDEYNVGRTPNPCIRCNTWLKFGKLAAYARSIDADYVATGHYARVDHANGRSRLLRAADAHKDQSYVLFGTHPDRLAHMLLPIGDLEKPHVRQLAEQLGLPVFDKPDSQEICFVPDNDYFRLVKKRTPDAVEPGSIVDQNGHVLGEHKGHQRYTIGQRKGLSVSLGYPIYVVDKDAATNKVVVGGKDQVAARGLIAGDANWLIDPPAGDALRCDVKIRSNSPPAAAHVRATGCDTLEVDFEEPQRAISPGQAAVCYAGEQVIGGGWIDRALS